MPTLPMPRACALGEARGQGGGEGKDGAACGGVFQGLDLTGQERTADEGAGRGKGAHLRGPVSGGGINDAHVQSESAAAQRVHSGCGPGRHLPAQA